MNTKIYKDKRASGMFFQKATGFDCTKAKRQATLDITKECGNGNYYTKNYVAIEYIVLRACSCNVQFISINTSLL